MGPARIVVADNPYCENYNVRFVSSVGSIVSGLLTIRPESPRPLRTDVVTRRPNTNPTSKPPVNDPTRLAVYVPS